MNKVLLNYCYNGVASDRKQCQCNLAFSMVLCFSFALHTNSFFSLL